MVDSGSTDGTQAITKTAGAPVIQFAWNGKLPRKKNWALKNVPWQPEWVLIIDADERITPELEGEIRQAIRRRGRILSQSPVLVSGWLDKSLRVAPFGTGLEHKRWLRNLATRAPFRSSLRILYHYVGKQGFRDGY